MLSLRRSASINSITGSETTAVEADHLAPRDEDDVKPLESRKRLLRDLLDALKEWEQTPTHGDKHGLPSKGLEERHLGDRGAENFRRFRAQMKALDKELQRFANAAREVGSSAGILASAFDLRRRLSHVSFLFRENAADLFPNEVRRHQAMDQPTPFGPAATEGLTPEDTPNELEALAQDIVTFLSCLTESHEFSDESLKGSVMSFQGDLKYWASCLKEFEGQFRYPAVARYVHDLSIGMADHLHRIESSLSVFIEVGIPTIRFEQRHSSSSLINLSIVAILFSVVTVTAVQLSADKTGGHLYDGVNTCWFTALILSVAAAVNALLGMLWQHATHRSPLHRVPWWVLMYLRKTPLVFFVASVAAFSVGMALFAFASAQSLVTTTMTLVCAGLTLHGLLCISLWSALERYVHTRYRGRRWASDALVDIKKSIKVTPGLRWVISIISSSSSMILPQFSCRRPPAQFPPPAGLVLTEVLPEIHSAHFLPAPRADTESSDWNLSAPHPAWDSSSGIATAVSPADRTGSYQSPHFSRMPIERFRTAVRSVIMLSRAPTLNAPIPKQQLADLRLFFSAETSASVGTIFNNSTSRIAFFRTSLEGFRPTEFLAGHQALVRDIQFSPNGKWLATCSWDKTSTIWKVGEPFVSHRVLAHPDGFVAQVAWAPNGSLILTRMVRSIKIWTDSGVCKRTIQRHWNVNFLAWMPSGASFLSVEDSSLILMDLNGKILSSHFFDRLLLHHVKVTPDGQRLVGVATVTASPEGLKPTQANPENRIFIYNIRNRVIENQVPISFGTKDVELAMSKNGQRVLVNFEQSYPQSWRIDMVKDEARLSLRRTFMPGLRNQYTKHARFVGKNDELVMAASEDRTIHIWDRQSGTVLTSIQTQAGDITALGSNPVSDSLMIAVGSYNGNVGIWSTASSPPGPTVQDKDRGRRYRKQELSRESPLDIVQEDKPSPPDSSTPAVSAPAAPVLDTGALLPFLTSASITADTITSLASTVKTCSQQSLELAARCRMLVQALNTWAVQKTASGGPSVDEFDAAKELKNDMRALKKIISERVAEEPSVAVQHWDQIVQQFESVNTKLFTPRYYYEGSSQDQERFQEAKNYDALMCTLSFQESAGAVQLPDVPAADIISPPSSDREEKQKPRHLLPA